ncbi:MAG TPA: hypothetical protein VFG55_01895 [Rhodanobacteraceae bacterium]|nr:hypothetical protein [Rhodanobacteraceae bacterium]
MAQGTCMRYLVCLLIGLVIGALATNLVLGALAARDVWPRSIMQVMQHELAAANSAVRGGRCSDADLASPIAHLDLLGGDIGPAVRPGTTPDPVFAGYLHDLRAAVAAAAASGPNCVSRLHALKAVDGACDRCHRDYR